MKTKHGIQKRIRLDDVSDEIEIKDEENIRLKRINKKFYKLLEDRENKRQQELPPNIYVIESDDPPFMNPLLTRMVAGNGFYRNVMNATRKLITPFKDVFKEWFKQGKSIRQVLIPNGGIPMDLRPIMSEILPSTLSVINTSIAKVSRYYNNEINDYVSELITYSGDKEIKEDILIYLDTALASGSTLEAGAEKVFTGDKRLGIMGDIPKDKKVWVFLICGSSELTRFVNVCHKYDIEDITVVYYNSIFDVTSGTNILPFLQGKTDLPVFNENTICSDYINQQGARIYNYLRMCTVGDTGNRLMNIALYYIETIAEILELEKKPGSLGLEQPEWKFARTLLNIPEFVDIANKFLELKLANKDIDDNDIMHAQNIIMKYVK